MDENWRSVGDLAVLTVLRVAIIRMKEPTPEGDRQLPDERAKREGGEALDGKAAPGSEMGVTKHRRHVPSRWLSNAVEL